MNKFAEYNKFYQKIFLLCESSKFSKNITGYEKNSFNLFILFGSKPFFMP